MKRFRLDHFTVAGLAFALTFAVATRVCADQKTFNAIQSAILKSARIPLSNTPAPVNRPGGTATYSTSGLATYMSLKQALHNSKARTMQAIRADSAQATGSTTTVIGSPPAGYGNVFTWDRSQQSCMLLLFLNPADPTGVAISGLAQGDTVQVVNATGLCSFSKDTGNPLIAGIITLIADGAADAVALFGPGGAGGGSTPTQGTGTTPTPTPGKSGSGSGANSAVGAIEQTGKDFAALFQGTGAAEKFRDPFGVDPNTHGYALQEGGVVVCMPQNQGLTYSSDSDHRKFWAGNPAAMGQVRTLPSPYRNVASQVPFFFLGQYVNNTAACGTNGTAYILAWDVAYGDNAGFYEVWVQLTRGGNGSNTTPATPASPAVARKARAPR